MVFSILFLGELSRVRVFSVDGKSVDVAFAHRMKNAVAKPLVFLFKLRKKLFHFFALGGVILRAETCKNRQILPSCKELHVCLLRVNERSYQCNLAV